MTRTKVEKNRKGGKPLIVFTEKEIGQVEALATYLNCEQIADHFGISHDTFTRIKERQSEVLRAYKKGKAHAIEVAGKSLMEKIKEGDTTAIIFFLKTQAKWSADDNKNYLKEKINFSKDKSPLGIIDSILDGIKNGDLTTQEATQLAALANLKASIIANNPPQEEYMVQSRETKERVLREIEKIITEKEKAEIAA